MQTAWKHGDNLRIEASLLAKMLQNISILVILPSEEATKHLRNFQRKVNQLNSCQTTYTALTIGYKNLLNFNFNYL